MARYKVSGKCPDCERDYVQDKWQIHDEMPDWIVEKYMSQAVMYIACPGDCPRLRGGGPLQVPVPVLRWERIG
jgi:hypothetical protein